MAAIIEKTRKEIEQLKSCWYHDPCWDIEDTPGFEAHKDELFQYRQFCETNWTALHNERLLNKSKELGCEGNLTLAAYVERLEERIAKLESEL